MNKNINSIYLPALIFLILSLLLFTSCKKAEEPENVCTLTAEQLPDVRGFQIGMSYDAIKQRFPNICDYANDDSLKIRPYKGSAENNPSAVRKCEHVNIENYPELEGISEISLGVKNKHVIGIGIGYDKTTDKNFRYTLQNKIEDLLGLSNFTNWKHVSNVLEPNRKAVELEAKMLTCNKVFISAGTNKDVSTSLYAPFLVIGKTEDTAITKAQAEKEKMDAENQKKAEDQKKRETFKP